MKKESSVHYTDQGTGVPVVLLHGYLENHTVWEPFATKLASHFRVICPDIPGHGSSPVIADIHGMDRMADEIHALLLRLNINQCFLFGHSMGGYITLAWAEKYPSHLIGFGLIHSIAHADTEERKELRKKTIHSILNGGKKEIIRTHVAKCFADGRIEPYFPVAERLISEAMKTPDDGVIALLRGMMERPDRRHILQNPPTPVLSVIGTRDCYIPVEVSLEQANLSPRIESLILENAGHMGHIEAEEQVIRTLIRFIHQHCTNNF